MNLTRSTRNSKIKNLARIARLRNKLTLSIASILSCICLLFVGGVASTVNPKVDIDNEITYVSDVAFDRNPDRVEFYIRSYEDLQRMAELVNANAVITGTDISYASATYTVLNDITNTTGEELDPIGTNTSPFMGTFNGGGHKIGGVKISDTNYVGLFGKTVNANINNIGLVGGTISATGDYVGSVIGLAVDTEIGNLSNSATVTAEQGSSSFVGGVIGSLQNTTTTKMSVENLTNTGSVTGGYKVGGVLGYVNQISLNKVHNTGKVTADGTEVGGIAGTAEDVVITELLNEGNVTGSAYVGGFIGKLANTNTSTTASEDIQVKIEEGINIGNVTGGTENTIGGIIGGSAW